MSQEAIVRKIAADAKEKCDAILSAARTKGEQNLKAAKERAEANEKNALSQPIAQEVLRRKKSTADLEVKKIILSAKQSVIADCFRLAEEKLIQDKDAKSFLLAMIEQEAEEGDVVYLSKNDAGKITQADINRIALKTGKKITLADRCGDFSGGVILSGSGVDKNLTYSAMLEMLRGDCEGEVQNILFKRS